MHPIVVNGPASPGVRLHHTAVTGGLRPFVSALMAVEVEAPGPIPFAVAPHESVVLTVQLGRGGAGLEAKGEPGQNSCITGIREWTGAFQGAGDCVCLFALLTPLGAVRLLESQPLQAVPRIRACMAALLDRGLTRGLESQIAWSHGLEAKLQCLGRWLEGRANRPARQVPAALRAGRAAMHLCAEPATPMETVAAHQHVSRRQLERDFARYIGTSPRHLAQVARVQAVSRKAQSGASLADIAADVGFADQAHLSRSVRQLTGLTPRAFVRARTTGIASAFRAATGGGTVYL